MPKVNSGLKAKKEISKIRLAIFILVFGVIGIILLKSLAAPNPNLQGDLNNDNVVNGLDLSLLLSDFNTTNPAADINSDGHVNGLDLSILLSHWEQSYIPPSSHIYWGAYLNKGGYVNYYGANDVNGTTWTDGPWSATLSGDTWDTFEAHAGKTMSLIHYGQPAPWRQAWSSGPANLAWNRGAIPVIDVDTTLDVNGNHTIADQTVADGTATINGQTYDSWWKTWFTAAKTWGHPFFFIPDVEMNGSWEPYSPFQLSNTPASFVAMWQHLHDLADSAGATNVTWVWCPNTDPNSASNIYRPLSSLYPGNSYVDWVGMDGFNFGDSTTFDQLFSSTASTINTITGSSKPFMLSQIGAIPTTQPSKAAWITDMFNQLQTAKYAQFKALVWFNWWHADSGTHDNDIETPYNSTTPIPVSQWASNANMPAAQAFAQGLSPGYFMPKQSTMPGFGKVPIP